MTKLACRSAVDGELNDSWNYSDELLDSMTADPADQGLKGLTQEWANRDR